MTTDDELKAARQAYVRKFDELCALLATRYGHNADPQKVSDERREQIAEEAEQLTENWNMAVHDAAVQGLDLTAKTELQRLIAEHHQIGEHILDLQDKKCREDGLIPDDSDDLP